MLEKGLKYRAETKVDESQLASIAGSGFVDVFATPMMIGLMEKASTYCVADELEAGQTTVGTKVNIEHSSATPLGMKVWCDSTLVEVDRKRLVFEVVAYDEVGEIGRGTHERFIIEREKFQEKANQKGR